MTLQSEQLDNKKIIMNNSHIQGQQSLNTADAKYVDFYNDDGNKSTADQENQQASDTTDGHYVEQHRQERLFKESHEWDIWRDDPQPEPSRSPPPLRGAVQDATTEPEDSRKAKCPEVKVEQEIGFSEE